MIKTFWILFWLCAAKGEIKQELIDTKEALGCEIFSSSTTMWSTYEELKGNHECTFYIGTSTNIAQIRTATILEQLK